MARSKTAKSVQIALTDASESTPYEQDWDFRAALQQLENQDGARFQITRIAPKEFYGFVGEILPAEFTPETIRNLFGPGTYRCQAIGPNNLFIEGGGRITIGPPSSLRAPSTPATPTSGAAPDVSVLLTRMDEQRAQREREHSDRMMRWAAILSPILAPAITKMLGGNTVNDVMTLMTKARELNGDGASGGDRLDTFLQALEYARKTNPEGGGDTWLGFARESLDIVKPALSNLLTSSRTGVAGTAPSSASRPSIAHLPGSSATPAPPPGNVSTAPPASSTPLPASNESDPMLRHLAWFRGTLEQLVFQARKSGNPVLYAEVILDNLPAGLSQADLRAALARQDWWSVLCTFYPAVEPYEGWLSLFRKEVLEMLGEPHSPPDPPTSAHLEETSHE